jgi:riboflavin kinase/FMN adenylyltransferase
LASKAVFKSVSLKPKIYIKHLALPLNMIQVHRDLNKLPNFKNAVVTIGTFDGVHLGHQQIIKQVKAEAEAVGGETVIITFHPHPRTIIFGGSQQVQVINTLEEKIELLNDQQVGHLVVVPFNDAFANQSAEEYIQNFLVGKFQPHTIIIGYDHHFGKNRTGDYHLLEEMGIQYNYKVKEIPEHVLNEVIISSTKIREALLCSDIETANSFLGYKYFFEGTVVRGNQLGRTIGYPTANLHIEEKEKLVPGNGVYAVNGLIKSPGNGPRLYEGMMNIGVRPTINGTNRMTEVNIFNFDEDIYGSIMRVYVNHYLRSEKKFLGLDELKQQLAKDKEAATAKMAVLKGEV